MLNPLFMQDVGTNFTDEFGVRLPEATSVPNKYFSVYVVCKEHYGRVRGSAPRGCMILDFIRFLSLNFCGLGADPPIYVYARYGQVQTQSTLSVALTHILSNTLQRGYINTGTSALGVRLHMSAISLPYSVGWVLTPLFIYTSCGQVDTNVSTYTGTSVLGVAGTHICNVKNFFLSSGEESGVRLPEGV
ncbi:hypothetical protein K438DRAFT_1766928 [Mycena galopus ATCC 62051]|nr:hypothetical protein K438DRAFT_1766928 [Mycena galopus ATCC 62051]